MVGPTHGAFITLPGPKPRGKGRLKAPPWEPPSMVVLKRTIAGLYASRGISLLMPTARTTAPRRELSHIMAGSRRAIPVTRITASPERGRVP